MQSLFNRFTAAAAASVLLTALSVPSATAAPSVDDLFVCETIGGENFCTDMGFIDPETEKIVRAEFADAVGKPIPNSGGDTSVEAMVTELLAMSPAELKAHQDAQLVDARASFQPEELTRAEEKVLARSLGGQTLAATASASDSYVVKRMQGFKASSFKQTKDYYCGPASLALIGRGNGVTKSQATWAKALGTTPSSGTALSNIVSQLNKYRDWWGVPSGYSVVNVSGYTTTKFKDKVKSYIKWNRPVVLHPTLRKQYFDYIAYDHGGHFQVGYGYTDTKLKFIEVYNEKDFRSGGKNSAGYKEITWDNARRSTVHTTTPALRTLGL